MPYRVCKSFEVESGHMLSKHPGACRYPHGHSRRVDVVLTAETLDARDMVCDFKTIKLAVSGFLQRFDHAMAINSADPMLPVLKSAGVPGMSEHLVVFENTDPTTEVLAERIYRFLDGEIRSQAVYRDAAGLEYRFPAGIRLERVRVTETTSSWAEFSAGDELGAG